MIRFSLPAAAFTELICLHDQGETVDLLEAKFARLTLRDSGPAMVV